MKRTLFLLALAATLLFPPRSPAYGVTGPTCAGTVSSAKCLKQVQAFNCDFDDNIFVTPARIMVWNRATLKETGFSTAEWSLVKEKIGKEHPWKDFVLRPDGLRYFGDTSPAGLDLFKQQIEQALGDGNWKGPSWNAFKEAMSRPSTRRHTTIITARMHSPEAILRGLQVLVDRGLLPALPDKENLYAVLWPGFPERFIGKDSAESKAKVMLHLLDQIEATPVPGNASWVEDREGTGRAKLHLWGFSDDDFGNFAKALEVLSREVARGRWPHVKISLFFTGLNHPLERPRSLVIRYDGTTRPTLPVEATRMGR